MYEKMGSRPNLPTRTILLKSPDSNKVREVIITEIVVPDSSNKRLPFMSKMDSFAVKTTRKRKLDHLTIEEKILRKKLKNREAAQTSRDRKKARMDDLEATVKRLTQEEGEALKAKHAKKKKNVSERKAMRRRAELTRRERHTGKREQSSTRRGLEVACRRGCTYRTCSVPQPSAEGLSSPVGTPSPTSCDVEPDLISNGTAQPSNNSSVVSSPVPDLFDLDWLSDCCSTSMEELEDFADSLYKEALSLEQSETQNETVVGSIPESMESNGDVDRASIPEPTLPTADPSLCNIKKEIVEEQVVTSSASSPAQVFEPSSEFIIVYPQNVMTANMLMSSLDKSPTDGNQFIVIEDAVEEVCCTVEGEEVVMVSSPKTEPTFNESEESECSPLNSPLKVEEESNSDHGYDSIDSPQSEPEELSQLFPELW